MSKHVYLAKDSQDLVCHCRCEQALVTFPPQMDCPWCGCGWLFSCMECGKAFTFARAVEIDEPWEKLARRDLRRMSGAEPSPDDVGQWTRAMQEYLREVQVGQRYVALDGRVIPADQTSVEFEGWHAAHQLPFVPQVAALSDPSIVRNLLGSEQYWKSHALTANAPGNFGDEDSVASNPGGLTLDWRQYIRYARELPIVAAAAIAIAAPVALVATLRGSIPWAAGAAFIPIALLWAMKDNLQQMRRHFARGNVTPAVVVGVDPVLIAAFTDLTKGPGQSFPAVKIIMGRMERVGLPRPRVGDRLVTVSMYGDSAGDASPSWSDFDSWSGCGVLSDKAAIDAVMATIPESEWAELTEALTRVPRPFRPGLYR